MKAAFLLSHFLAMGKSSMVGWGKKRSNRRSIWVVGKNTKPTGNGVDEASQPSVNTKEHCCPYLHKIIKEWTAIPKEHHLMLAALVHCFAIRNSA